MVVFFSISPVWRLSRAVCELPAHQPLVAAQRELGTHQEAPVKVGEAENLEQRRHRRQGGTFLLCAQLGLGETKDILKAH